jgi:hypothetical protein
MDSIERLIRENAFELSGIFGFESLNTVYTRVNRLATIWNMASGSSPLAEPLARAGSATAIGFTPFQSGMKQPTH